MKCTYCGAPLPANAARCPHCNTMASWGAPAPAPAAGPAPGLPGTTQWAPPPPGPAGAPGMPGAPYGAPYGAQYGGGLPPSHKKRSVLGPVLLSILAVVVLAGAVAGGLAIARNKSSDESTATGPVVTLPPTTTTASLPAWAVDPNQANETPSMQAIALVCAGVKFPGRLADKAKKGTRSVAYWWKTNVKDDDADFIRGGGIAPGPKHLGDYATPTHDVGFLSRWAPLGWVACVSLVDLGPAESVNYCIHQETTFPQFTVPGQGCGSVATIAWYGHTTWKVEVREAATGKKLTEGQIQDYGEHPQHISFEVENGTPTRLGVEPTEAQVDNIVHSALG